MLTRDSPTKGQEELEEHETAPNPKKNDDQYKPTADSLKKLQEALGVPKTQPIVLYFDEANALHKLETPDKDSYYDALCTTLSGIRPAFGIFLSTKSSLVLESTAFSLLACSNLIWGA